MSAVPATSPVIDQLRRQLLRCQVTHSRRDVVSSGFQSLDRLLPESGLPSGAVIEWVSSQPGIQATTVALHCAVRYLQKPGALAIVDPAQDFHPMSINHMGIAMSRLLLVRPDQQASSDTRSFSANRFSGTQNSDALWALEQLARCAGVRVVMMWVDHLTSTAQRRLQLAVEKSGATVFLMRPVTALQQTSWADLRFQVQSAAVTENSGHRGIAATQPSRVSVRLVRSKNSVQRHGRVLLDWNHETGDVFEAAELADSASVAQASC